MSPTLTARQKEILDFIRAFRERLGISPTHREICEQFGFSSYGTAYKHLKLLRAKGLLTRERHQRRSLAPVGSGEGELEHRVAFLGRIAAGQPIEAVTGDDSLAVPPVLLGGRGEDHYVLRVAGDSMIEEGIHDGDWVVVERRERARPGEMVVALVGQEVTLKRYFPEGETVRLQPAHPTMQPIRAPAADVRVQGIVVGLMRKY